MRITRPELVEKIIFVNGGMEKLGLPRVGWDKQQGRNGKYCMMMHKNHRWVQETELMTIRELWTYLDGMLHILLLLERKGKLP